MSLLESLSKIQTASRSLVNISEKLTNTILLDLANELLTESKNILDANQKDLNKMNENNPKYDRLLLNKERLEGISNDIKNVASLTSPLDINLEQKETASNLHITKISVPIGVIGIIYEARPNVTFDVFSLCFKSGNACVLKGGSDAENSNIEIIKVIHGVLKKHEINTNIVHLLSNDRAITAQMLKADKYIDLIIPRGSQNLINFVRENSKVPVIETGAGIVHTYFSETGDIEKGSNIIFNAKTRRVSVCNALDCLVIHESRINELTKLTEKLSTENVEIYADNKSHEKLKNNYPANLLFESTEDDYGREFLSHKMSIKVVSNTDEAIEHVTKYTSKHSEAIITEDNEEAEYYMKNIDAAVVYQNTSTAFTDGAQFGLGAEIGISTQKLHARGPMALRELTSYKWIVRSEGEVRE